MSIKIDEPRKCGVNRRDTDTYLSAVKNHISQEDRIVVIVTPGSLQIQERYDAIKQWCTEVRAIPTQFVRSVTLEQPRKMDEICSNILVQMNCKVGGVPWSVDMPLENVMYVGIDVYKGFGANKQEITIMGFVASTNSNGTRWYSKVDQQPQNGICDETMGHAMKDALYMYKNKNRAFPRNIVIYRKEGNIQWTNVDRYEWLILYRNIQDVYQKEQVNNGNENVKPDKYMPYIVLMTVARRISPGFSVEGVPTVFDDDDTLPVPIKNEQVREALSMRRKYRSKKSKENEETSSAGDTSSDYISADDEERRQRHEPFFLCTQNTKLSCFSPVFVRVLRQSGTPTGLKEDDDPEGGDPQVLSSKFLQKLSVKLCYLYYNIAAVCYQPSPILYSQKLAFFVGNHLKQEASENLDNVLFYL